MRRRLVPITFCLVLCLLARPAGQGALSAQFPTTADELLQTGRVWNIHLTFTREAWAALRPAPPTTWARLRSMSRESDGFMGPEGKRNGISAQQGLDFEYSHATLEFENRRFADVGVRHKGNGTYGIAQQSGKVSFKVDLDKFLKGQKLAGVTGFNLHSNITDVSSMNEPLAYRLYRDAGVPAPRTAYARVFITVPGVQNRAPYGLYSIVEDVDRAFAENRFKADGGALFKPVTMALFSYLGDDWARYNQRYDPKTTLTDSDKARLIDFCRVVTRADDRTFAERLPQFLDVDAFAQYLAVLVWLANPDSLLKQGQNFYLHLHPTTRQFTFVPWDQDHSFGQYPFRAPTVFQRMDILRPWTGANRFLERTMTVPAFRDKYLARLSALTKTTTLPARLTPQVDALAAVLGPVVAEDTKLPRLPLFKKAIAGESFERPFYGGVVVPIKTFVPLRQESVLSQLRALRVP
ncbi:MAG: CotH kinase family protein [Vicinamibacterales bacterium]